MGGIIKYPRPWELWWAFVQFEDSDEVKRRPVIVLDNGEIYALVVKVTSHAARPQWGEYELIYWKSAGLPKESTARLTQLISLEHAMFDKRIGQLHPLDIENILHLIQQ